MGTKHPMSSNSSCFIEPYNSHCPFTSSCATVNILSTSSPTQAINHPLVTLSILINHTPPTNSPYQAPTLHVNVGSQPYTFPNPFDHTQLGHFPLPTLLVPIVGHDHTPQPTPISSTHPQLPPKVLCPIYELQFTNQGLAHH
jgi:hypothetical protein